MRSAPSPELPRYSPLATRRRVFLEGVRDGVPIGLGYLAVSFSLGIAAACCAAVFIAELFLI